ncbi:hypothetical protein GCM10022240_28040 [Microbacterium kribbense]|uniref:Uncharacterized protein n=1 Tax=Microbacterium kribbense TaxID=433645 RepID=A0ABP7GUQ1_9MICO
MLAGRRGWIAWPVGLICLGVVGGLVWLAAPGVPAATQFVGDLLRSGSAQSPSDAADSGSAETIGTALTDDCRSLYPDGLWVQLSWQPHVVLDQSQDGPVTTAVSVRDALRPDVQMTCTWRQRDGSMIRTTLAKVDAATAPIARAGLASQGFDCTASGDGIRCAKTTAGTREEDVIRGRVWLSTTETGWHPEHYTDALIGRLWS